jgi:nitroreductase
VTTEQTNDRELEYDANAIFPNRWSPRAMSGESIPKEELMSLFDAARWAPSCFNAQPWRFIYAMRDTEHWEQLFSLLMEGNQSWCKDAAALAVVVSNTLFEHNGKANATHSYDTGAAWSNLALQGSLKGLVVHGMAGFYYDRAKSELGVPDDFKVEAMCAIGRPGNKEDLPEALQEREVVTPRKPVAEIALEGRFSNSSE